MDKGTLTEIFNKFNVYKGSSDSPTDPILGIGSSLPLPTLDMMTETFTAAGILGEVEATNPGHYSNSDVEIPFICIDPKLFDFNPNKKEFLTLRASVQSNVKATGELEYSGVKVVIGGKVKGFNLGNIEQGKRTESTVKMNWSYLKIEMKHKDGTIENVFELDKYNSKNIINGVDVLADINAFS